MPPRSTLDLSVVMVDGGFRERFHAIDFFTDQTLAARRFELIWVEHSGQVSDEVRRKVAAKKNARVITLGRLGEYHSSYCFNAGIAAARGRLLVIPDGDLAVERDFLARLLQDHRDQRDLVEYVHRYDEPEKSHREAIELAYLRRACVLKAPSNWGGCISVRKKWLLAINGYEQHPEFSSEDQGNAYDVYTRLKNLGLRVRWSPRLKLYHPWHPGTARTSPSHRRQAFITGWRAVNLSTLPFRGIDPSRDSEMPSGVATRLNEESEVAEVPEKAVVEVVRGSHSSASKATRG